MTAGLPSCVDSKVDKRDERIVKLEKLLAIEIQRAAELLRENQALTIELDKIKRQRDALKLYYKKSQRENKIRCDRDKAMVIHGEVDMSEVLGSK